MRINGRQERCHISNPGRLRELLQEGSVVLVREARPAGSRSTSLDLVAVRRGCLYVSIDSRLPNLIVEEALRLGKLPELAGYAAITANPQYGRSRFDFRLEDRGPACMLEVKGCTLVRNGIALFPDAPTKRGRRHLEDLAGAKQAGYRSVILFLAQRADAKALAPNDETDRTFADALRDAVERGVEALAYAARMEGRDVRISGRIPLIVDAAPGQIACSLPQRSCRASIHSARG